MINMTSTITNTISISAFNRGLAGKIFDDVKQNGTKVVMKNNTAECVLLSPDEYVKLMDEVNDARLLLLALKRLDDFDYSKLISEADILKKLNISEDDLSDFSDVEIKWIN